MSTPLSAFFLVAAVVVFSAYSSAAEKQLPEHPPQLTADEQKLIAAMETNSKKAIEEISVGLQENKARYKAGRQAKQPYQGTQKFLSKWLSSFKKNPLQIPELKSWDLKVGRIGFLRCGISSTDDRTDNHFKVFQVINESTMLVETDEGFTRDFRNVAVIQKELTLWVSGVSTEGLIDGEYVQLPQIFEVIGTKGYSTAIGGRRTVIQIAPFSIQDPRVVKSKLSAIKKHDLLIKSIEKLKTDFRFWTDSTGKHKTSATVLAFFNLETRTMPRLKEAVPRSRPHLP